jgi:hypothetical protein
MSLRYHITGTIWPPTVTYCYIYNFVDYYFFLVSFLLLTWASIERHIFIFHKQFFNSHIKRLLGHYIPLAFCCIYPLVYYVGFMYFYPCDNYYDVSIANCAVNCFLRISKIMAIYEQAVYGFTPIFLIYIFNIALIIRVIRQKHRVGQEVTWSRNRKMTLQLLCISCLAFFTNSAFSLIQLGQLLWDPNFGMGVAG